MKTQTPEFIFDHSVVFENPSLTEEMKMRQRRRIKMLAEMQDSLEENLGIGTPLSKKAKDVLYDLTGEGDPTNQLMAVERIKNKVELQYHTQLRKQARRDLPAFCEYMDPEFYPAFHHRFFCTKLMQAARKQVKKLIINVPLGHAKTTYSSQMFPAWYLGNNPRHKIIGAGHTQSFAENVFGKKVRGHLDDPRYRDVFPDVTLSTDSKAAGFWSTNKGGSYLARGIGSGIAGFRGNIAILDDPYASREDAESETTRAKVYDWFKSDLRTRLLPGSPVFVIGTRWHPLDLFSELIAETEDDGTPSWELVNLPGVAEENDPLGRPEGQALWPEFYTLQELMDLKSELPTRDWNSLYRGQPIDDEAGVVMSDWIKRYTVLPEDKYDGEMLISKQVKRVTVSVDTASKAAKRNDPSAITVWVEDGNHNHYLKEVVVKRLQFTDLVREIERIATKHGASAILVEDAGAGTQYIQTRSGKAPAPIIPISTNNKSKEFRFEGVSPMFQAGEVLLPERAPWLVDYETELLNFPAVANDDQVDSTSQYLAWARRKIKRGTKKLRGLS